MRKEPFTLGSYVHIIKRGTRGLPLVRDESDRRRFVLMLRHFNDQFCPDNWFQDLADNHLLNSFDRPAKWPPQQKLVEIVCYCLVENHFHLLLKEIVVGGISQFMKRLGVAMTGHYNEKYQEKGSLFQGAFKSKTVDEGDYFNYVSAYIQIKNCFELFPGGYDAAVKDFTTAFRWAKKYPYCSLGEFAGERVTGITDTQLLSEIFSPTEYAEFSQDFILGRGEDLAADIATFE